MKIFYILIAVISIAGCNTSQDYEILEKNEVAKGIHRDTLFLGLKFGMTDKEFFDRCWQLNSKGMLSQGGLQSGGIAATYKFTTGFNSSVLMNFYPVFYEGKIAKMNADFNYEAWAPWNKRFFADSLQAHVIELYEKWYGKGFFKFTDPHEKTSWVKVDGNRKIAVSIFNEEYVTTVFTDLFIEKEIEMKRVQNK